MKISTLSTICFVGLMLVACSSEKPPKENTPSVIPQAQLDALEKAKGVEKSLQEAVDERDKAMRERGT